MLILRNDTTLVLVSDVAYPKLISKSQMCPSVVTPARAHTRVLP
jgi:hypothetical protein